MTGKCGFGRTKRAVLFATLIACTNLYAQTLPIGSSTDEAARSFQLMGRVDSSISFAARPLNSSSIIDLAGTYSLIDSSSPNKYAKPVRFAGRWGRLTLLPLTITQQFTTHHPYGWNDGSMIAAKGYQALVSMGIHTLLGPVELQLQPEFVYASNAAYETNGQYGSNAGGTYSRILPGQSSIRVSSGALSVGVSTENLWWGPGIRNSLVMTNNAPGFGHIFFKTRRPIKTAIGNFEWQLIGGKLLSDKGLPYENYNLKPVALSGDWRYLSGVVISYHPKWVPGLFLGVSRITQTYNNDLSIPPDGFFERYFTVLALAVEKKNVSNDDNKSRDQIASFFLRWMLTKAKAEFYIEYGFNDYGVNVRDYLMAPTHAGAYIAGFKKIVTLNDQLSRLEFGAEITQLSQSPDYLVRDAGNWYTHNQVLQGYTNNNQIMGAGAGLGCNVQSMTSTWIKGWKQLGILLERVERDPLSHTNNWIDLSIGVMPQFKYRSMVFSGKFQFINSNNYAWQANADRFNIYNKIMVQYLF